MTATQMKYEFDVGYDFITNFEAPGVEPKEVSTFLTQAQEEVVLETIKGNAFNEQNKRILDVLKGSEEISVFGNGSYPTWKVGALPDDVFHIYNEIAELATTSSHFYGAKSFTEVEVMPVDDDFYIANKKNPFKKPNHEKIWRLTYANGTTQQLIYIIDSNTTLENVLVFFYRKPEPIIIPDDDYPDDSSYIDGQEWYANRAAGLDCELDPIVHRKIVERAVKLAYAAMQDEKGFQISSVKEKEKQEN